MSTVTTQWFNNVKKTHSSKKRRSTMKCLLFTHHRECQIATAADRPHSCIRWVSFRPCHMHANCWHSVQRCSTFCFWNRGQLWYRPRFLLPICSDVDATGSTPIASIALETVGMCEMLADCDRYQPTIQRIRGVSRNALYKSTFTYLLTYIGFVMSYATADMNERRLCDSLRFNSGWVINQTTEAFRQTASTRKKKSHWPPSGWPCSRVGLYDLVKGIHCAFGGVVVKNHLRLLFTSCVDVVLVAHRRQQNNGVVCLRGVRN